MGFGRLERTQGNAPISDINVTPLVDVMLVLVVILIITAPLLASAIRLDLPDAQGTQPSDAAQFVSVAVDPNGGLYFNDRRVTQAELSDALALAARQNPATEVQLRADRSIPYGRVVEVMGLAQKAGLNRVGFVAEPAK